METQKTLSEIKLMIESSDKYIVRDGYSECVDRNDVPLEWLEKGINHTYWFIRETAIRACANRIDIPKHWVKEWIDDEDYDVRIAAFKVSPTIPISWLKKGLIDSACDVRKTVSKLLFDRGYKFPLIRKFEPPYNVYKKCRNGVIVVATIPKTAQIRGSINYKGRASEATIIEIIPNSEGFDEAVSLWDIDTKYVVGNHIVVDNFDPDNYECGPGFHFFSTFEAAKQYTIFPFNR